MRYCSHHTRCAALDDFIPGEFLLSICGLVEYLHIDQGCGVFFGLPNEDWAQLITEMFAKRVSYVEIDNFDFSFLSTREQVQHVIEVKQVQLGLSNN